LASLVFVVIIPHLSMRGGWAGGARGEDFAVNGVFQTAVLASPLIGRCSTARGGTMTGNALTTTAAGASPKETVVVLGRRKAPGAFEVL
jgi:hypothetical protein